MLCLPNKASNCPEWMTVQRSLAGEGGSSPPSGSLQVGRAALALAAVPCTEPRLFWLPSPWTRAHRAALMCSRMSVSQMGPGKGCGGCTRVVLPQGGGLGFALPFHMAIAI